MYEKTYSIMNPLGTAPLVLAVDHASNRLPRHYHKLGLTDADLQDHIAYDIGAADVAAIISDRFDAPAILQGISRLLVDTNRRPDQEGLFVEKVDGRVVPGNMAMAEQEKKHRVDVFYHPFHRVIAATIEAKWQRGIRPLILSVHSFTPEYEGESRPWDIGLMWCNDDRLAKHIGNILEADGVNIGWNQPYSGKELMHTMVMHGEGRGLPTVQIEIRQDHIGTPASATQWAKRLMDPLQSAIEIFASTRTKIE